MTPIALWARTVNMAGLINPYLTGRGVGWGTIGLRQKTEKRGVYGKEASFNN